MKLPKAMAARLKMTFAFEGVAGAAATTPPAEGVHEGSEQRVNILEEPYPEDPFEIAGRELVVGNYEPGAWARAVVAADGDAQRIPAEYVRLRVAAHQSQAAERQAAQVAEVAEHERLEQEAQTELELAIRAYANEQAVTMTEAERMLPFAITKLGDHFVHRGGRYLRLEDAIAMARKVGDGATNYSAGERTTPTR